MIYFERLQDGSIDQATDDIMLAKRLGFYDEQNTTDSWGNFIIYQGKKYLLNEIDYEKYSKENKIKELREKREYVCFPIINRGKFWFNTLSQSQIDELEKWYKEWLDVTETLVEPTAPNWLK